MLIINVNHRPKFNLLRCRKPGAGQREESQSNRVYGECNRVSLLVITSALYLRYTRLWNSAAIIKYQQLFSKAPSRGPLHLQHGCQLQKMWALKVSKVSTGTKSQSHVYQQSIVLMCMFKSREAIDITLKAHTMGDCCCIQEQFVLVFLTVLLWCDFVCFSHYVGVVFIISSGQMFI